MALDKNDLISLTQTNFPDNTSGAIMPTNSRSNAEQIITANANLEELTPQEFKGPIAFDEIPTYQGNPLYVESAYCDYSLAPNLTLTATPQLLTGWFAEIAPNGISESLGVFTIASDGIYNVTLERIYENDDNNPADQVFVTIQVFANDGTGAALIFDRTAPIPSATAGDEPAILSFTTPANRPITAGTTFEIYVSAVDGAASPEDTRLINAKVVANLIHVLPEA